MQFAVGFRFSFQATYRVFGCSFQANIVRGWLYVSGVAAVLSVQWQRGWFLSRFKRVVDNFGRHSRYYVECVWCFGFAGGVGFWPAASFVRRPWKSFQFPVATTEGSTVHFGCEFVLELRGILVGSLLRLVVPFSGSFSPQQFQSVGLAVFQLVLQCLAVFGISVTVFEVV